MRGLKTVVQPSQVHVGDRDAQRFRARKVLNSPVLGVGLLLVGLVAFAVASVTAMTGPRSQGRRTPMTAFPTMLGIGASLPPTTYQEIKYDAFATAQLTG